MHARTPGPPARSANPDRPGSFTAPTRGSGITDATVAAWQQRHRQRRPRTRHLGRAGGAHPQRGVAQPTPAAGPSRAAAGKEPGPLRSSFSHAQHRAPVSRETGTQRGHAPAPRGTGRLGLTRPRSRAGCRSQAIGGRGRGTRPPAAGAPDVLEETATRRDGRDPGTKALCQGGSLCSRRGSGTKSRRIRDGSGGGGRPPAARGTPRGPTRAGAAHTRLLSPFPWLSRPTAQRCSRPAPAGTRTEASTGASRVSGHLRARGATRPSHSPIQ